MFGVVRGRYSSTLSHTFRLISLTSALSSSAHSDNELGVASPSSSLIPSHPFPPPRLTCSMCHSDVCYPCCAAVPYCVKRGTHNAVFVTTHAMLLGAHSALCTMRHSQRCVYVATRSMLFGSHAVYCDNARHAHLHPVYAWDPQQDAFFTTSVMLLGVHLPCERVFGAPPALCVSQFHVMVYCVLLHLAPTAHATMLFGTASAYVHTSNPQRRAIPSPALLVAPTHRNACRAVLCTLLSVRVFWYVATTRKMRHRSSCRFCQSRPAMAKAVAEMATEEAVTAAAAATAAAASTEVFLAEP